MSHESLILHQWRDGERRLMSAASERQVALDRVTDRIVAELRKRLGGSFAVAELVELYDAGTSWCTDIAYAVAPGTPEAWDPRVTTDAAFARYLRAATDYAGGRTGVGGERSA